jgi:hypothetical protein
MDALIKDLIREITTTTGAALTLTLTQNTSYGRFSDAASVGQAVYYALRNGDNSEIGIGTVQAGNTLDRTTPLVTVVGGVYDDTTPVKITLVGTSTVALAPTASALNDIISDISEVRAVNKGTGVTSTYVSTVVAGGTTFAQPAVNGEINSDEGYFTIVYAGATGITVANLTAHSTYVYVDNTGTLQQQTTTPTRQDWSRKMFTMRIAVNITTEQIINFEYLNNPTGNYANSIRDVYAYLLAQGIPFKKNQVVTGRAADLGFDVGAGTLMEFGGTGDIHNANILSFDAVSNASYFLLSRTAVISTETELVKYWDNAGTITLLGSTTVVGHRLYRFSSGNFAMQYGQGNYANIDLAKTGVLLEDYVLNSDLEDATFFGWWFIQSTATNTGGTTLTGFKEYTIGIQGGSSGGLAGCLLKGNNLSDLLDAGTARANLGISENIPARNSTLNKEAVTQGTSTRTGMSSKIYTGNGTSQAVSTGVNMATGDFGGLVWVKERSPTARSHGLFDTVRGATKGLQSDSTITEFTLANTVTSFSSTGFSVGNDNGVNASGALDVAWSFQTNQKITGTTNRNKAYTAHYNSDLGFSIVGYVGDGVNGHEIPHHLGVEPELSIFKSRNSALNWEVQGSILGGKYQYLRLNTTGALATATTLTTLASASTLQLGEGASNNGAANNFISYHFASKAGVSKVGKYIGTGAAGNYVDCGFKVGWLMVKNLTSVADWYIIDGIRSSNLLSPNLNSAEISSITNYGIDGGFVVNSTGAGTNGLNDEYLFLAFAETNTDATKSWTDYDYATTQDTLSIQQDTLISFANGFSASGQQDTQENVGAGVTYTLGAGFEDKHYWLYKDKAGSYGVSEYRPLEGLTRNDADTWGEVSPLDASLRTTAKHFDYESSTGVALASTENAAAGYEAYMAFNKNSNDIVDSTSQWTTLANTTTGWLQYKLTEARILKSWRFRESATTTTQSPKRFTIEGSNDGFAWTAIDSTYTASDYAGNGTSLWGDIQSTSANTTAYLYHRINVTLNNGSTLLTIVELEFNTTLPSDYYLVNEGIQYNNAGTAIERTYLAELMTNTDGEVSWFKNLPVAKQRFNSVDVHGDLLVKGEISNQGIATAGVIVDCTVNPPLISGSFNVKDVVDLGAGLQRIYFTDKMDTVAYFLSAVLVDADALNINNIIKIGVITESYFDVRTQNTSSTAVDRAYCIKILGGKK